MADKRLCWCGCGAAVKAKQYFLPGHDKRAEAMLTKLEHPTAEQPVVARVEAAGYGPGGRNLRATYSAAQAAATAAIKAVVAQGVSSK